MNGGYIYIPLYCIYTNTRRKGVDFHIHSHTCVQDLSRIHTYSHVHIRVYIEERCTYSHDEFDSRSIRTTVRTVMRPSSILACINCEIQSKHKHICCYTFRKHALVSLKGNRNGSLHLVDYDGSRPREERPGPRSREVKKEEEKEQGEKQGEKERNRKRIKNAKEMSGKEMGDNRSEGKIEIEPTCKIKSEKKGLVEE